MRSAAFLAVAIGVVASGVDAQQTERIGRIELSNGYLSVDARSDGLVTLSAVSTLKFGVGSGAFSPRTLNAWLAGVSQTADSLRRIEGALIGSTPTLFGVDGATRLNVTFELTPAASIASAVFARADDVEVGIAGTANDSSFHRLVDLVRLGAQRTTELTLSSRDSVRLSLSDAELSGRTTPRDSVAEHPPTTWRTADRLFVTAGAAALTGLGMSYLNHQSAPCTATAGYCRWRLENPGFAVGAVLGASLAGLSFTRNAKCSTSRRVALTTVTSTLAAVPGALVARSGKQAAIGITPTLQAIALDVVLRRCRD